METVEVTFTYTQSEYVKAERQYLIASKLLPKRTIVIAALYLPLSIFYLFLASFNVLSIVGVAIAVLAIAFGCAVYFYAPGYRFKQTAKFQEEYKLKFSDDGIEFTTPTLHSDLKWGVYSAFIETDQFYFLIQVPRIYTLIPKRVFASVADQRSFEKLIATHLKNTTPKA